MPNWQISDPVATLISTVFSTSVATGAAWLFARGAERNEDRRDLSAKIGKMIDISLQYPFVEDPAICDEWPKSHLSDDDKLRYKDYCCYVFNVMSDVWRFARGKPEAVRKILHVDELIWKHRCWWRHDKENVKAYDDKFVRFVNDVIKTMEA